MPIAIVLLIFGIYVLALFSLRNRAFSRSSIVTFFIAGGALAFGRIAFLWYSYLNPQKPRWQFLVSYLLSPEGLVLYVLNIRNPTLHMILFTLFLALGSLILVCPLLLIGSKKRA